MTLDTMNTLESNSNSVYTNYSIPINDARNNAKLGDSDSLSSLSSFSSDLSDMKENHDSDEYHFNKKESSFNYANGDKAMNMMIRSVSDYEISSRPRKKIKLGKFLTRYSQQSYNIGQNLNNHKI